VFLFDEPLSNLDAELRVHMRIEIAKLHRKLGTTVIYVTHDQVEAMTLANKIVVLRGGSVEQIGAPLELYDNPANLFVAGFIGSPKMNFLKGVISGTDGRRVGVRLPDFADTVVPVDLKGEAPSAGATVTLGLRPVHFSPDGEGALDVTVDMLEHLGSETLVYARGSSSDLVTIAAEPHSVLAPGSRLTARFRPADALLFDDKGSRIY
jgi:lactose/L-arabinose transport system ATP-binding protein